MSRNNRDRLYHHQAPEGVEAPPSWAGWVNVEGKQWRVYARYIDDGSGQPVMALQIRTLRTLETEKSPARGRADEPSQNCDGAAATAKRDGGPHDNAGG